MKLLANIATAVVILLLLAGVLIPTVSGGGPAEPYITRHEMSQASISLRIYYQEYGELPADTDSVRLVQILEGDNPRKLNFYTANRTRSKTGEFLDGWDRPLIFKPRNGGLLIRSAGKDGIYYTKEILRRRFR
jgi:hypothetical protein